MASSTEMQFGPSWLKPTTRTKPSKTSTPVEDNNNHAAAPTPTAISYSSITRDHPTTPLSPGGHGHDGGANGEGGAGGGGGPALDHIVDPSKPFRYTKEYMLGLYDEEKQKGRELPFEFERWGVVFREEGGNPVSLAPLTDMEKKVSLQLPLSFYTSLFLLGLLERRADPFHLFISLLQLFTLPYNPDRRAPNSSDPLHPSASRNNSSSDLHSRRNRTLAGQAGTLNLERGSGDRAIGERGERGGSALNSPARERFGGIQGGVLGGLAGAGGVGEGRLGGLSRERSDRRTSGRGGPKEGEVGEFGFPPRRFSRPPRFLSFPSLFATSDALRPSSFFLAAPSSLPLQTSLPSLPFLLPPPTLGDRPEPSPPIILLPLLLLSTLLPSRSLDLDGGTLLLPPPLERSLPGIGMLETSSTLEEDSEELEVSELEVGERGRESGLPRGIWELLLAGRMLELLELPR